MNELTAKREANEASKISVKIEFTDDYAKIVNKLAIYLVKLLDQKKKEDAEKF